MWSRTPARAERLSRTVAVGVPIEPAADVRATVDDADVVVTLTPATEPLLRRERLAPGAHVNAIGGSSPHGRELDETTLVDARVVVDWRVAAVRDGGELMAAIASGAMAEADLAGELGEVLDGTVVGREHPDQLTVFKSVGVAVEDLAVLELLDGRARGERRSARRPFVTLAPHSARWSTGYR